MFSGVEFCGGCERRPGGEAVAKRFSGVDLSPLGLVGLIFWGFEVCVC